jgi:hypothetical protein
MKSVAQECPDRQFGQQSADQLPWFHEELSLDLEQEAEA